MSAGFVPTITMFSQTALAVEAKAPFLSLKPVTNPEPDACALAQPVDHRQQEDVAVDVSLDPTVGDRQTFVILGRHQTPGCDDDDPHLLLVIVTDRW